MTTREHFAGLVLQAMVSRGHTNNFQVEDAQERVGEAVYIADLLIKELSKEEGEYAKKLKEWEKNDPRS